MMSTKYYRYEDIQHRFIRPLGYRKPRKKSRSYNDVVESTLTNGALQDSNELEGVFSIEYIEWCKKESIPESRYDPYGTITRWYRLETSKCKICTKIMLYIESKIKKVW